jgi:hypothetical protein
MFGHRYRMNSDIRADIECSSIRRQEGAQQAGDLWFIRAEEQERPLKKAVSGQGEYPAIR